MKRLTILCSILAFLINDNFAQKAVPGMILIQNGTVNYNYYKDIKQGCRATDFHISQYVEANYQYQQYLKYLEANALDSLLALAQPNRAIWDSLAISKKDAAFLKDNYWSHPDFASYPVLGLNIRQIHNYFDWKTARANYAFLQKKRKVKKSKSPYEPFLIKELLKKKSLNWRNLIAAYSIPSLTFETVAMSNYSRGRLAKPKFNSFDKWLQKNEEFKFLSYQPVDKFPKTALQKRLYKLGIKSVIHTNLMKLLEYRNQCAYYELVLELPLSMVENYERYMVVTSDKELNEWAKNYDGPVIQREIDEVLAVKPKSNYGKFSGIEKKEGNYPLLVFRGTTVDRRTVIIHKDKEENVEK